MLYQVRFNYTDGGEFTLNGDDYVGFFNTYSDGSVSTGKYRDANSQILAAAGNFSADYYTSPFFKDLNPLDAFTLPHNRRDVQIDVNELVNFTTINTKFGYLHENLMYVYSKMFCGGTDVPYAYDYTACYSNVSGSWGWFDTPNYTSYGYSPISATSLSAYSEIDNIKRFVVIPFEKNDGFSIIGISNTHLIGLTSSPDFSNISLPLLYTNVIDNNSDERCQNLTDLTFDGKYLFVTDSSINSGGQVFKYDVISYFTGDAAFANNRYLIKPIGGLGKKRDANKFRGCSVVGSIPGAILVYDKGNGAIKIFDRNLVWLKTIPLPKGTYEVLDIKHRPLNNHIYILVRNTTTNQHMMYEYNTSYWLVNRVVFEDVLYPEVDGQFNRMTISNEDSNVFYLATNTSVYKKFFSRPEKTFAVFKRDKFGQSPIFKWDYETVYWNNNSKAWNLNERVAPIMFSDANIMPSVSGVDSLFLLSSGVLFHFSERTQYSTVLRNNKMPYYSLSNVQLELPENIQSLTLNKEFYKMYSNIVQLKNNLCGRFSFEYNGYGDLEFQNYIYFLEHEIDRLNVEITLNTRVNNNELVQAGVINKLILQIYDLQQSLLDLTAPYIFNFRTVTTNQNVLMID